MLRNIASAFNKYPLAAPIISAGLLSIVGDSLAQHVLEKKSLARHDYRRTARLTLYGFFIIGPVGCLWLRFLDKAVIHRHIGIRTIKRVLLDQLLFAPIFLGIFFVYSHFTENGRLSGITRRFERGYFDTLMANYKLWPAVQCVNFCLIPLNYQLLFVNVIAIGWTAFLSNANQKASQADEISDKNIYKSLKIDDKII